MRVRMHSNHLVGHSITKARRFCFACPCAAWCGPPGGTRCRVGADSPEQPLAASRTDYCLMSSVVPMRSGMVVVKNILLLPSGLHRNMIRRQEDEDRHVGVRCVPNACEVHGVS